MSTPSKPLFIGIINICIKINSDIAFQTDNSNLDSWIILWKNQNNIFVYLPNHQHTIGSIPGALSKKLIPFLGVPQTFMHCPPGLTWIETSQSNPTKKLFVEGVFMKVQNEPSSSQQPNLALMFFTWYPKALFIIEIFINQDLKLKIPKEYDCNSYSQCQLFTPTTPTPNATPPSYPEVFYISSKQKLIQLLSGSYLFMMTPPHIIINTLLLPHQKPD
ncbi:hypothetical protein O181_090218 [Austropuccinia psidii MF-1]|uniref:Uncharacterized protein n=1 Tax=Austropuccinia psidii MF-1 TaxID=1389203 RepID=A0A9Q3P657_9BASI|nr:hypothetical protein [Austropuccinia psidii MF-1]